MLSLHDAAEPIPHSMRSYVDDTLTSAPLRCAKDLIASWEEKLSSAHLQLKRAKLQIYVPDTCPRVLAHTLGVEEHACRSQGMIVCGFPLSKYDTSDTSLLEEEQAVPTGADAFVQSFLSAKTKVFRLKLACLEAISDARQSC